MKDIIYEILSEVHHLLSIASEEELRHASELPNTSIYIRHALEALAAEKAGTKQRIASKNTGSREAPKNEAVGRTSSGPEARLVDREFAKAFWKKDKAELQSLCQILRLPIVVKKKDARGRIIQRILHAIDSMTESDKSRVLAALRIESDPQTEGWAGVIRKGQ